jgi:hypothetical protein
MRSVGESFAGMGEWLREVGFKITHDPIWGGTALVLFVLMLSLVVVQRRAR